METRPMDPGHIFDDLLNTLADKVVQRLGARLNEAASPMPRLLTVEQAAEYLGRSAHSVRHLIRAGRLPVVRLDDRLYLDRKDLDRVIEEAKGVAS